MECIIRWNGHCSLFHLKLYLIILWQESVIQYWIQINTDTSHKRRGYLFKTRPCHLSACKIICFNDNLLKKSVKKVNAAITELCILLELITFCSELVLFCYMYELVLFCHESTLFCCELILFCCELILFYSEFVLCCLPDFSTQQKWLREK